MITAKNVFDSLISQSKITMGLYNYISINNIPLDSSDLLRWQWVLAVSALDKYIHDIVRIGMVDEYSGKRPSTPKYKSFQLSVDALEKINLSTVPELAFGDEVSRKHSYLAFQDPQNIADALSYIWIEPNKWKVISKNMKTSISDDNLKTILKNIVIRRNQIVHEGDCFNSILPLRQQPISLTDTEYVIEFICDLVNAIKKSVPS